MADIFKEVPACDFVQDHTVYPRASIDSDNVRNLATAIQRGNDLPAVIADQKTMTVIDGYHRIQAYVQTYGELAAVPTMLRKFKSRRQMIEEAVRLNMVHGLRLTNMDRTRAIKMLESQGVELVDIAVIMCMPERTIEKQIAHVVYSETMATIPGTMAMPNKSSTRVLDGQTVTADVAVAVQRAPGTSYSLIARQLCDAAEHHLLETDNERLRETLTRLVRLLADWLGEE